MVANSADKDQKRDRTSRAQSQPWQEGLSFNFVNLHLTLSPGTDTGFIPHSTPIFTVFPVLSRQSYKFDRLATE
ncbi:MAG: hypothetical protein F4X63_03155 [Nitrospira sp. SB0662_bin_26]|nr:hypothetical protein [Nitrospira sp. SB0662_bin_26]